MKISKFVLIMALALSLNMAYVSAHDGDDHSDSHKHTTVNDTAKNEHEARKERIREQLEERKSELQEKRADRCEIIAAHLEAKNKKAELIKEHRMTRYNRLIKRLEAFSDRLKVNDYDSTQMDGNIDELKELVEDFEESLGTYVDHLANAAQKSCMDKEARNEYLATARSNLADLREKSKTIHEYLKNDVKETFETIRLQLKEKKANEESVENEQTEIQGEGVNAG